MRWTLLLDDSTGRIVCALDFVLFNAYFDVLQQIWQICDMTLIEHEHSGELPDNWYHFAIEANALKPYVTTAFEANLHRHMGEELKMIIANRIAHHKTHTRVLAMQGLPTTAIGIQKLAIAAELAEAFLSAAITESDKEQFIEIAALQNLDDASVSMAAHDIIARHEFTKQAYTNLLTRGYKF